MAVVLICISTSNFVNALEPSGQRNSDTLIRFSGSVSEGQKFSRPIGNSLNFVLNPNAKGFHISIQTDHGVGISGMATPPFHGVNDLSIEGWHFRKSDDSAMNAPGKERRFGFLRNKKFNYLCWVGYLNLEK